MPVPFNFNSIEKVFGDRAESLKAKLAEKYPEGAKIPIYELTVQNDPELAELADYVFSNVFAHYTEKQWGVPIGEVSKETLSRVPVFLSYDNRYFQDRFQGMPKDGYTEMFCRMLDHENITVKTGVDAAELLTFGDGEILFEGKPFTGIVIFSGALDELFGYEYGKLPYRTLDFAFETHETESFQPNATVNYTVDQPYTRITEFKKLTGQTSDVTTVMKEYSRASGEGDTPYYAILNPENLALYEKYAEKAARYENFFPLGRLAEYRYYNMDAIVARALELCDRLIK